jgi:hypothetical protein
MHPQLDIVVYAVNAPDTAAASERAKQLFERTAANNLHLALSELPADMLNVYAPGIRATTATVTCLRSVLMKPEHRDWIDRIVAILENAAVTD